VEAADELCSMSCCGHKKEKERLSIKEACKVHGCMQPLRKSVCVGRESLSKRPL